MRLFLVMVLVLTTGCTDAAMSRSASLGSKFKITIYSGGQIVREFTSTGKVLTEENSDGWYFKNSVNNKLVMLSGDVVIEQID